RALSVPGAPAAPAASCARTGTAVAMLASASPIRPAAAGLLRDGTSARPSHGVLCAFQRTAPHPTPVSPALPPATPRPASPAAPPPRAQAPRHPKKAARTARSEPTRTQGASRLDLRHGVPVTVPNPHDALFQTVFSQPEHAAGALQHVLPESIAARIRWSTLT